MITNIILLCTLTGYTANIFSMSFSQYTFHRETITDINAVQTIIVDGMIYANLIDIESSANDGLYRMHLDGTDKEKLIDTAINCMQYDTNYIYYASQHKGQLYRIDLNGKNKEAIVWKETGEYLETTRFIINNGWIYFNNENKGDGKDFGAVDSTLNICRIRIDGTGFKELASGVVSNVYSNSEDNYLLYISEYGSLNSLNLDTMENKQILNAEIDYVNVIDDVIYALDWRTKNNNSVIYCIDMKTNITTILGQ